MSQSLSKVRKVNSFYREQQHWWVSPKGDIVHWTKAMDEISNPQNELHYN